MPTKKKYVSQLRQDLVSGDWVVIALLRGKRPHAFFGKPASMKQPKSQCPFEHIVENETPLVRYDYRAAKKGWSVVVIPNKFPAFVHGVCGAPIHDGPYRMMEGVGFHELFVMRDHSRFIPDWTAEEVENLFRAYRARYRAVSKDACVAYASVFHNHGREAGASLAHPHSQMIALPVIPPDVSRSIRGSERYFHEHGTCVHCEIIQHELREKKRVVAQNERFVLVAPYASKIGFELRIFPKIHQPSFGMLQDDDVPMIADMLKKGLAKLRAGLNDPAYNYFIHTAPDGEAHAHYHWHIEIVPKTSIWAGFEIGTGIEISSIAPEDAARYLRKIKA